MTTITSNAFTIGDLEAMPGVPAYWIVDPRRGHLLALRIADGTYEPYADSLGPVALDWPIPVSFSVGDLARPPAR